MLFFTVFRPIKLRKTRYKPFESCIVHQYHSLENRYGFQGFSLFLWVFMLKKCHLERPGLFATCDLAHFLAQF